MPCLSLAMILAIFPRILYAESAVTLTDNSIKGSFFTGKIELDLGFTELASPKVSYLDNPYRIVFSFDGMNFDKLPLDFGSSVRNLDQLDFRKFSEGSKMVFTFDRPYEVKSLVSSSTALDGKQGMRVVFVKTSENIFIEKVNTLRYAGNDLTFQTQISEPELAKMPLIIIDAGHGGNDPGAVREGVSEKNVTLSAALLFAEALRQTNRFEVELTRNGDDYVSLLERRRLGERVSADLFLSIHADTVEVADVQGMTIYTLSEQASSENAAKFAQFENRVDLFNGSFLEAEQNDLSEVLAQMAQNKSMAMATKFSSAFRQAWVLDKNNKEFPKQESAAFAVLKAPDVPSLLIELGFLSNQKDRIRIQDPVWLDVVGKKLLMTLDQIFYPTAN